MKNEGHGETWSEMASGPSEAVHVDWALLRMSLAASFGGYEEIDEKTGLPSGAAAGLVKLGYVEPETPVSRRVLGRIAMVLGIPMSDLVKGDEPKKAEQAVMAAEPNGNEAYGK